MILKLKNILKFYQITISVLSKFHRNNKIELELYFINIHNIYLY